MDNECIRCGRCCMHMHSDDNGMPCESLLVKNGLATCLIHDTKPDVCKNYPNHPDFGGEPCFFRQEAMNLLKAYDIIEGLTAELKAKDELLFAYESVKAPVNPLLAENKRLRKLLALAKDAIIKLAKVGHGSEELIAEVDKMIEQALKGDNGNANL